MSEKILLVDGHSILNRAFYGLPEMTNSEGLHTNAVYGFLTILFKTLEEEQPDYLAVAFDLHAPTFRHKMYGEYKGTRKGMPEELREQVPMIRKMLEAMEIRQVSMEGFEADDLLGTLAVASEKKGMKVTILSGDRDLLQLATDDIKIRIPKTRGGKTTVEDYNKKDVLDKYQLLPEQIVDLKALMGDSADNIPGLPGVGEKTATKILLAYETLENAHEHLEEIKPNRAREAMRDSYDLALLSQKLAKINVDSPVNLDYQEAKAEGFYTQEAYDYCKQLDFKNLLGRFECTTSKNQVEDSFSYITEFSEAESIFQKASMETFVGIQLIYENGLLLGMSLAAGEEKIGFLPVEGFVTEAYLTDKLTMLSESVVLCAANCKELLKIISVRDTAHLWDLGIGAYLLNPLKSHYTYDDIAKEYMNLMVPTKEDFLGKKNFAKAMEEMPDKVGEMACYMAYIALASRKSIGEALKESGMQEVFHEIEMPLVLTLSEMEKEGIGADIETLREYSVELGERIGELEKEIYKQAGEEFNINSPKQMGIVLFEKLNLPGGKKTKTGYSTAADVLEKMAPEHKIVKDILEYRQLAKLKSTYADGLATCIDSTGRIHSTFNQTITATGRISSTEPNLQNIPIRMELGRLIRKAFVPREGFVFLDADYSQIELRVLAHMSKDERLIQAYQEAKDIHRMTASQVFHIPFDEVTPLQRRNAKAVNFGIVYGISSFGLSQDLSITRKEAAEYIQSYFETYPKIKGFLDGLVEDGKELGYVTTMFGRRRPMPELKSSNFMQRSFGERVAMNAPIQGTAADIIKIAMNRVYRRLTEGGYESRLILQVHDELLIETKKEELDAVSQILEEEMKGAAHLAVALEVDMHTGKNWYEAK